MMQIKPKKEKINKIIKSRRKYPAFLIVKIKYASILQLEQTKKCKI